MKYVLVFIIVTIISFGSYVAYYLGAYKKVEVSEAMMGPYTLVYMDHVGPYHKIAPVIAKVESWMKDHGHDCSLSFGQYLDNPRQEEEARLKSRGGCLVKDVPKDLPQDFKVMDLPAQKYVTASFDGSPGIGPIKVYPKANEYIIAKGLNQEGPVMEIYDIHSRTEKASMTTTYLFWVK